MMIPERFDHFPTRLRGLVSLARKPLGDHRGYLERMFCTAELGPLLDGRAIVQINRTLTARRGTLRGMHFQHAPYAETKIVSCLRGSVYDVAVDLRAGSPTFLEWHGEVLSAENRRTLFIPEGFAHGFQTLTDDVEMLYLHTAAYNPDAEAALNALDPRVAINWPNEITERSSRDQNHPFVEEGFEGLTL